MNGKYLDGQKVYAIMQLLHLLHDNIESWCNMAFEMLKFPDDFTQEHIMELFCIDRYDNQSFQLSSELKDNFDYEKEPAPELIIKRFDIIIALLRIIDTVCI